jgi:hypothetical protein
MQQLHQLTKAEAEMAEILMETEMATEIREGKRVFFFISVLYKLRELEAGLLKDYRMLETNL